MGVGSSICSALLHNFLSGYAAQSFFTKKTKQKYIPDRYRIPCNTKLFRHQKYPYVVALFPRWFFNINAYSFEGAEGYQPAFGLVHIDFSTQKE